MRTLIPQAYGQSVTKLGEGVFRSKPGARNGPIRTAPVPFTLVSGEPKLLLNDNFRRKGLIIKNLDTAVELYVGFGIVASVNDFFLDPLGAILFDFICPTDAIWCLALANVQGMILEFSASS